MGTPNRDPDERNEVTDGDPRSTPRTDGSDGGVSRRDSIKVVAGLLGATSVSGIAQAGTETDAETTGYGNGGYGETKYGM